MRWKSGAQSGARSGWPDGASGTLGAQVGGGQVAAPQATISEGGVRKLGAGGEGCPSRHRNGTNDSAPFWP